MKQTKKVLLLEDDIELLLRMADTLKQHSYETTVISDGNEALRLAKNENFDIYIIDISSRKNKGIDFLKFLSKHKTSAIVAVLSDNNSNAYIKRHYEISNTVYLKKPFTTFEFKNTVLKIADIENTKSSINMLRLSNAYAYDLRTDTLFKHGHEVRLSRTQLLFIKILTLNLGVPVSNEEISRYVWNAEFSDSGKIRSLLGRLRNIIDEPLIQTCKGSGYKIAAYSQKQHNYEIVTL